MATTSVDFVLEYKIHEDPERGIMFVESDLGVTQMRIHPNAVVYTGVPLLRAGSKDVVATIDLTIWEVDSSRDTIANHYGMLVSYHGSRGMPTWDVKPYLKSGDDWVLEPTSASGLGNFVISGFRSSSNPFTLHAEGWKTYRASKNASLFEI